MKKKITTTTEEFDKDGKLINRVTTVTEELPAVDADEIAGGSFRVTENGIWFTPPISARNAKTEEPRFRIEGDDLYCGDIKIGEIVDMTTNWVAGMPRMAVASLELNPFIEWDDE
ncbi:MAG: hypothetical protein ACRDBM_02020 [Sporomusa sp.]